MLLPQENFKVLYYSFPAKLGQHNKYLMRWKYFTRAQLLFVNYGTLYAFSSMQLHLHKLGGEHSQNLFCGVHVRQVALVFASSLPALIRTFSVVMITTLEKLRRINSD